MGSAESWNNTRSLHSIYRSIPVYKTGLLAPYGVWVCFAAVLNYEIWRLNR